MVQKRGAKGARNAKTPETLIIGAGPAGMACAAKLAQADHRFTVVEQDTQVGGLSQTYQFVETERDPKTGKRRKVTFLTDNGPHRFFSKNAELYEFIGGLLGERWIKVRRQTRQFIDGKFYEYPINAVQALKNIGPFKTIRILLDYLGARILYGIFRKHVISFDDYAVSKFGRTLGEFNIINYTEKIWGIPSRTIHADWAKQRIKGLSLRTAAWSAFKKMLGISGGGPKSLVDAFYYPDSGTGLIYETIRKRIESGDLSPSGAQNPVWLRSRPTKITHNKGTITGVTIERKDAQGRARSVVVKPKRLVESIPITEMLKLLSPAPPPRVQQAAAKLRHRSQVYVFITLNKNRLTRDQWIYFPTKKIPFGRSTEMKNFSAKMCPKGKTSLFVEYFCFEGDEIWSMKESELFELTLKHFEELGFFKRKDVRKHYVIRRKFTYPVYDLEYQKHLKVIMQYLESFENLLAIGRPGRFRYNNQDHSLEMGFLAAKSIIERKKYDIGSVGSEKEYFEAGKLHGEKEN